MTACAIAFTVITVIADAEPLRLTLENAVRHALSRQGVHAHYLAYEAARYQVTAASGRAFDLSIASPVVTSRLTTPTIVETGGAADLNDRRPRRGAGSSSAPWTFSKKRAQRVRSAPLVTSAVSWPAGRAAPVRHAAEWYAPIVRRDQ